MAGCGSRNLLSFLCSEYFFLQERKFSFFSSQIFKVVLVVKLYFLLFSHLKVLAQLFGLFCYCICGEGAPVEVTGILNVTLVI